MWGLVSAKNARHSFFVHLHFALENNSKLLCKREQRQACFTLPSVVNNVYANQIKLIYRATLKRIG